jgi:hypothetical protein
MWVVCIDIFRIDIYVKPHSWILYNTHQIGLTSTAMAVWLLIAIRIDIFRIDIYVKPHSWILYNTHQIGLTSTVMAVWLLIIHMDAACVPRHAMERI